RTPAVKASDKIDVGSNITDGNTLVSAGGSFTLGFFSPPGLPTTKRFLAIWFSFSPDAVYWVANRDRPLSDTSGVLVMTTSGTLVLFDGSHNEIWSSGSTSSPPTGARLLETGNFVLQGQNNGTALWQAFDHPCNTLLPGMKMGKNLWSGAEWYLSSWSSATDPSPGSYRYITEPGGGTPENVLWFGNNTKKYRTGPWNGERFDGVPEMASYASNFTYQLTVSQSEVTYGYTAKPGAPYSQIRVSEGGVVQRLVWDGNSREWNSFLKEPRDDCDDYGKCGPFGLCDRNAASTSLCSCFRGFVPASPDEWSLREYSGGCRRNVSLDCGNQSRSSSTDGFQVVGTVKLPDTQNASVDMGISLDECRVRCLANCSCVAYAAADITGGGGGSGCITWTNSFVDLRFIEGGQDFYLRLPKSELGGKKKKKFPVTIVAVVLSVAALLITSLAFIIWCKRRGRVTSSPADNPSANSNNGSPSAGHLSIIDYKILKEATQDFSPSNIIGQGHFATVYKCVLPEEESTRIGITAGEYVAVKKLDQTTFVNSYKRELQVMSRLRHVNLLRLLAFCEDEISDTQGDQENLRAEINWERRLEIITSIAEGVFYLHLASGEKVIHRDLKPSNVLLDHDWTPKIADFGMAKQVVPDPTVPSTRALVSIGYSAPECGKAVIITHKADLYSFGVVLLEIISGQENGHNHGLIHPARDFWDNGNAMKLLDRRVPPPEDELKPRLERCIQIGLLCVQELPEQRPDILKVLHMLKCPCFPLDKPMKPTLGGIDGETQEIHTDEGETSNAIQAQSAQPI
ncbi:Receptor-like serine/threonine-protein kinase SD1-8, partial [Dichanthelium oligosanthes]